MAGVRRKRSQKKKRANSTVSGRKLKKRNKVKVSIDSKAIRKTWDQSKTLKQNFKDIGLSYNPNTTIPVRRKKDDKNIPKDEPMEIDNSKKSIIKELEAEASEESKMDRHISPGEAKFLWELIKDHGENYKAMARDKKNYQQHTESQLKRKCTKFLNSSQDFSTYLNQPSCE